MLEDTSQADHPGLLASSPVAGAGPAPAVTLPTVSGLRAPRLALAQGGRIGRLALAAILALTSAVVAYATAGQSVLVARSYLAYPAWEAGPLHILFRWLPIRTYALSIGLSVVVVLLLIAYALVLASIRSLTMRAIVITVLALHAIVLFSPPMQLTDIFNYLGYARLGGLHDLNPYRHGIATELHDPIFKFSSWHALHSPYGPLFTVLTYPLALVPMPVAYWVIKTVTLAASLGFVALVWQCARQLGRDPRYAVALVALNPIYVVYAMGGFHNDFFMLIPMMAAISLLLAGRDRSSGAVLMLAVAIKFSALLLLPFLLLGARSRPRHKAIMVGCVLGAVPLIAMSLAVFGFSLPNLRDQSTLLTVFSFPNVVGLVIGLGGGAPVLLRLADALLVLIVVVLLRRRGEWLSSAGWATLALIASLAWLMPWYVIWLLPLAGLGTSMRLRRLSLALTVYLVFAFMPFTGIFMAKHSINLMNTPVGRASNALQHRLGG